MGQIIFWSLRFILDSLYLVLTNSQSLLLCKKVTVLCKKVREINNRFAHKYGSTNIFIKSQDVWDWKRPLKTVWSKLLGQAGPHSWLSRTVFHQLLNFSKSGNYTTCPGHPVPVCDPPHCEKVFPCVQREPAMFQFTPIALFLH